MYSQVDVSKDPTMTQVNLSVNLKFVNGHGSAHFVTSTTFSELCQLWVKISQAMMQPVQRKLWPLHHHITVNRWGGG